jgi:hypothetical protein
MDVHKESISIAVMNAVGKIVMECVIETKASLILQFIDGLRGDVHVTFEEGTSAAWLYDLLKPHVTKLVVCDPRGHDAGEGDLSQLGHSLDLPEPLGTMARCIDLLAAITEPGALFLTFPFIGLYRLRALPTTSR